MKKLFLLLGLTTLLSCSKSDDDSNSITPTSNIPTSNTSSSKFHPPAWIQGTWVNYSYNNPSQGINGTLKFTPDDIMDIIGEPNNPMAITSFKEIYKASTVTEEFFPDKYITTSTTIINGSTLIIKGYYFKTSNTSFKFDNQSNVNDATLIYHKI